jgi:hypothetical protein
LRTITLAHPRNPKWRKKRKATEQTITLSLLKALPHVKHWWETYWEKSSIEESGIYGAEPTWGFFVDVVKEQYYPVGNYEDQYMRWTALRQERGK